MGKEIEVCANCKWFSPAGNYFFCDNEHVCFVEQGLTFTFEVDYWGCNQWEAQEGEE